VTDFDFTPEQEAFRSELRAFLAERLPPDWQGIFVEGDAGWRLSLDICRELGGRGWLTIAWPEEYGGKAASIWLQAILQEEYWAHNEPRGPQYMNVNWLGPAIIHFGTEEQKRFFLPELAAGEMMWAQGFSEPEAGSDLAALKCSAVPDGDGFVVNGQKDLLRRHRRLLLPLVPYRSGEPPQGRALGAPRRPLAAGHRAAADLLDARLPPDQRVVLL